MATKDLYVISAGIAYLLDDEEDIVNILRDVVESLGLQARGFTCAADFLAQLSQMQAGSVILLDLQMPEIDGIEVMRRLATLPTPPALILISGHDAGVLYAAEKLGRAHRLEILASLHKPLRLAQLQEVIARHLPGQRSASEGESAPQRAVLHDTAPTLLPLLLKREELAAAIAGQQLVLYYQPQVEMASGRLAGVEALVRWQHPERGELLPDCFIPLAEQEGLIGDLTHWVMNQVVQQIGAWEEAGLRVTVSANISANNITSLTLPEQLSTLLSEHRLDPTRLTLEVTESALMGELVTSLDILTRLRLKGIRLSIDDFGTGYSSLSQLHRVPFTELKIDRTFVTTMAQDSEARSIVKTCVLLGHELDMQVVAEGVEDRATWDLLTDLGCDLAQGYHIARAMPGEEILPWLQRWMMAGVE